MARLLMVVLGVLLFASGALAQTFSGMLVKVVDGDTVHVLKEGRAEKIRLADIDCPERGQPFGAVAKQFVLDVAAQKMVRVDVKTTDRYGRKVGLVTLEDGRVLNRELVRAGLAWWYRKYSRDEGLGLLEMEARAAGRGLWADVAPVAPWRWRKSKRYGSN